MRIVAPIPQQGGSRIPKNPFFLKNAKNLPKHKTSKNVQRYANISNKPFNHRSLIHQEAWFPPYFVRQNLHIKKLIFVRRFLTTYKLKCSTFRPLLSITFAQGFRISKNIGHPTSVSGGKKTVKLYLKSEHTHTNKQTNIWTF